MARSREYRGKYLIAMRYALCSMLFLLPAPCYAASASKSIEQGNRLYHESKLDETLQKYNEAGVAMADSDIINFNMGVALYKKEDYRKAQDYFTKALTSDNKQIEADALYNLGNCKYKLGKLKESADLSATMGLLRESLDYYKRAVEIDQKNIDARFNHEFVERELKVLLDKLKQQQSEKGKQQKNEQAAQPQEKQENRQKQEEEKSAQAKEEQQKKKQQEEGRAAREESKQGENKELSEEGARTLLERYGRDEAKPDYMDRQAQAGYDSQVSKDW